MPVVPHAEPFHAAGGSTAVLLVHGFTGSPASMRPWADHLGAAGFTVALPRLPGHGTRWQDLDNDAATIFSESVRFLSRYAPALADSRGEPHAV